MHNYHPLRRGQRKKLTTNLLLSKHSEALMVTPVEERILVTLDPPTPNIFAY